MQEGISILLPGVQDAIAVWLTRAQTALSNIADHQVQLQEGTAAQQQLSKAWWGFRDKVHPAVLAAQQANIPIAAAEHIAAASASAVAAAPTASLNGGPVSSKAGAADVQPGVLSVNGPKASSGQEPDDGEEEEEVGSKLSCADEEFCLGSQLLNTSALHSSINISQQSCHPSPDLMTPWHASAPTRDQQQTLSNTGVQSIACNSAVKEASWHDLHYLAAR